MSKFTRNEIASALKERLRLLEEHNISLDSACKQVAEYIHSLIDIELKFADQPEIMSLQERFKPQINTPVYIRCNRWFYAGILSQVHVDFITLQNAFVVEIEGNETDNKEYPKIVCPVDGGIVLCENLIPLKTSSPMDRFVPVWLQNFLNWPEHFNYIPHKDEGHYRFLEEFMVVADQNHGQKSFADFLNAHKGKIFALITRNYQFAGIVENIGKDYVDLRDVFSILEAGENRRAEPKGVVRIKPEIFRIYFKEIELIHKPDWLGTYPNWTDSKNPKDKRLIAASILGEEIKNESTS